MAAISPMSGAPTFDTEKKKKRGECVTLDATPNWQAE